MRSVRLVRPGPKVNSAPSVKTVSKDRKAFAVIKAIRVSTVLPVNLVYQVIRVSLARRVLKAVTVYLVAKVGMVCRDCTVKTDNPGHQVHGVRKVIPVKVASILSASKVNPVIRVVVEQVVDQVPWVFRARKDRLVTTVTR